MIDVDTIELSLKQVPTYNPKLAQTVNSRTKKNYLIGSSIATSLGLLLLLLSPQGFTKILGGGMAGGGAVTYIYTTKRKVDDSSEAEEERIKFKIAESIRQAKITVDNTRKTLTQAAHETHSFCFDTVNTINDTISFNSYTVQVTARGQWVNVGLRPDKILYRTENRAELYTTKRGKVRARQRKVKVPDRVKFTIAFPDRSRAVKGVMSCESYDRMVSLYNQRHQKAKALLEFNNRYTTAENNVLKTGDKIYLSTEEKQEIEAARELEKFDRILDQIGQEVPVQIDEGEFTEFDKLLGLDSLSDRVEVDEEDEFEIDEDSDDNYQFTESDLRSIGLPAIRRQFNITARSYAEAFAKLREQGISIKNE